MSKFSDSRELVVDYIENQYAPQLMQDCITCISYAKKLGEALQNIDPKAFDKSFSQELDHSLFVYSEQIRDLVGDEVNRAMNAIELSDVSQMTPEMYVESLQQTARETILECLENNGINESDFKYYLQECREFSNGESQASVKLRNDCCKIEQLIGSYDIEADNSETLKTSLVIIAATDVDEFGVAIDNKTLSNRLSNAASIDLGNGVSIDDVCEVLNHVENKHIAEYCHATAEALQDVVKQKDNDVTFGI